MTVDASDLPPNEYIQARLKFHQRIIARDDDAYMSRYLWQIKHDITTASIDDLGLPESDKAIIRGWDFAVDDGDAVRRGMVQIIEALRNQLSPVEVGRMLDALADEVEEVTNEDRSRKIRMLSAEGQRLIAMGHQKRGGRVEAITRISWTGFAAEMPEVASAIFTQIVSNFERREARGERPRFTRPFRDPGEGVGVEED